MKTKFIALLLLLVPSISFSQVNRAFLPGYEGTIEAGSTAVFGKDKVGGQIQLATVQGYRFGNGFTLGIGAGVAYDLIRDGVVLPVFLDAKYNIADYQVSPFVAARTGARLSGGNNRYLADFISVSVGCDSGHFSVRIGYEYGTVVRQKVGENLDGGGSIRIKGDTIYTKPSGLFCLFSYKF